MREEEREREREKKREGNVCEALYELIVKNDLEYPLTW